MATLGELRTKLNGEVGVSDDAGDPVWSQDTRSNAIVDGYAALWRVGIWKRVVQSLASVDSSSTYALTSMRRLDRIDVLDSFGHLNEGARAVIEEDGAGGYQLRLVNTFSTGFTLKAYGWTAYKSQFANDADTDDLAAEFNRIPLLKAKAILWRAQLGSYARYQQRQSTPPEMSVSIEGLVGMIAAAEREFTDEAKRLADMRPRSGQVLSL